jgi:hypothetical protein
VRQHQRVFLMPAPEAHVVSGIDNSRGGSRTSSSTLCCTPPPIKRLRCSWNSDSSSLNLRTQTVHVNFLIFLSTFSNLALDKLFFQNNFSSKIRAFSLALKCTPLVVQYVVYTFILNKLIYC